MSGGGPDAAHPARSSPRGELLLSDGSTLPRGGACFLVARLSAETVPAVFRADWRPPINATWLTKVAKCCVVEASDCRIDPRWSFLLAFRRGRRRKRWAAGADRLNLNGSGGLPVYAFSDYAAARVLCDELEGRRLVELLYFGAAG